MGETIIDSNTAMAINAEGDLIKVSSVITEDSAGIVSITTTNHETGKITSFTPDQSVGTCELCYAENQSLRPYGPNNEKICFDCGMKDQETTAKKLNENICQKSIDINVM